MIDLTENKTKEPFRISLDDPYHRITRFYSYNFKKLTLEYLGQDLEVEPIFLDPNIIQVQETLTRNAPGDQYESRFIQVNDADFQKALGLEENNPTLLSYIAEVILQKIQLYWEMKTLLDFNS